MGPWFACLLGVHQAGGKFWFLLAICDLEVVPMYVGTYLGLYVGMPLCAHIIICALLIDISLPFWGHRSLAVVPCDICILASQDTKRWTK